MEFNAQTIGDVIVVELLTDILDAGNAKEFRAALTPVLEQHKKIVFDMQRITFLDSSGCGTILSCLRQLNSSGGDLKMCGVQKPVRALFELIRMHRIVEIHNTREEAVKSF